MLEPDPRSDAELLAATRHEPEAFAVFYRRYASLMLGFAVRRLGDAELAADVTSEAFAAALASSDRFDASRGSARSWLFGITANQVGSALRRGRAESRARRRLGMEPISLADDQRAWVQALADEQDAALVMRLLAELPECDRALLEQRVIGGVLAQLARSADARVVGRSGRRSPGHRLGGDGGRLGGRSGARRGRRHGLSEA